MVARLDAALRAEVPDYDRFEAQVWIAASDNRLRRYVQERAIRERILRAVYANARRTDLDPDLVLAVMHVESFFDPYAISRAGAQGLMQIMPFWRLEIGRTQDILTHIETNVRYGTTILAHYLARAEGDLVDALARYNGSRGRTTYPNLVVNRWRRFWQSRSTSELPELWKGCEKYRLPSCNGISNSAGGRVNDPR
ncbi:MAG: transglycosylase SLT domain-containing protein [Pseudomonadota bacterium]